MIKTEYIEVWGFKHAIRGMRNPMNSWNKSDSGTCKDFTVRHEDGQIGCDHKCPRWSADNYCGYSERLQEFPYDYYMIGKNDLGLMRRLYKGGTEHRKYLRQIFVSMDITAPLFWWKQFDTYKVGTAENSCSTMHKIHAKEFDINDFSHDYLEQLEDDDYAYAWQNWVNTLNFLNHFRDKCNKAKDKRCWRQLIEMLPDSYNQKRTVTLTYENVMNILRQRSLHKLDEWVDFCNVLRELPYVKEIIGDEEDS